ncbi:MAG: hypothetical protein JW395_0251 [Nitrospira sp.]|nr:hypothetical protein [Nitrospira sp.]
MGVRLKVCHLRPKATRVGKIILIEPSDERALGLVQNSVARRDQALIDVISQNPYPWIGERRSDLKTVILGAVVEEDQFPVCVTIREYVTDGVAQVCGTVVERHANGNEG